jgi:hypothetical protein
MSISYSCVKLNNESKNLLYKRLSKLVPEGWEWIADHMTIKMGALNDQMRETMLGTTQTLEVVRIGISDMAIAVEVTGCQSLNGVPHVTIAINKQEGARPYMSNNIVNWHFLTMENLTGTVIEVVNN